MRLLGMRNALWSSIVFLLCASSRDLEQHPPGRCGRSFCVAFYWRTVAVPCVRRVPGGHPDRCLPLGVDHGLPSGLGPEPTRAHWTPARAALPARGPWPPGVPAAIGAPPCSSRSHRTSFLLASQSWPAILDIRIERPTPMRPTTNVTEPSKAEHVFQARPVRDAVDLRRRRAPIRGTTFTYSTPGVTRTRLQPSRVSVRRFETAAPLPSCGAGRDRRRVAEARVLDRESCRGFRTGAHRP